MVEIGFILLSLESPMVLFFITNMKLLPLVNMKPHGQMHIKLTTNKLPCIGKVSKRATSCRTVALVLKSPVPCHNFLRPESYSSAAKGPLRSAPPPNHLSFCWCCYAAPFPLSKLMLHACNGYQNSPILSLRLSHGTTLNSFIMIYTYNFCLLQVVYSLFRASIFVNCLGNKIMTLVMQILSKVIFENPC